MSIQRELDETRRLVKTFDAIDTSMTEARDKLKTFYKTADETNTLLDMWIRVLSQTEHTQKLLQDPAWEGYNMEEARYRENQERRAAYQQAMEEANNHHRRISSSASTPSFPLSSPGTSLLSYSTSSHPNSQHHGSTTLPLKKSPSAALVAAAHAHASAIAASRKRNMPGAGAGGGSTVSKA
ncbi:hypothetical protein BGZ58_006770 [Dissophora ornata]|nr:hypothetical protein BGZ58_006770 [Dissophora ornata]